MRITAGMRRPLASGAIIALFGAASLLEAHRLGVGTLSEVGAGFVPLVLGVVLCGLGLVIAMTPDNDPSAQEAAAAALDWRGGACILGGSVAFLLCGLYAGLIPAAFASVFIAALGDRTTRLPGALLLATGMTVFGALLFGVVLQSPIPLLRFWPR